MSIGIIIFLCIGISITVLGKNTRFTGGEEANIENFPYYASLRRLSNSEYICGGAIISHLHVLTTANCIKINLILYSDLIVHIGIDRKSDEDGLIHLPKDIICHPMHTGRPNSHTYKLYNIAIIKLTKIIRFNSTQNRILLPTMNVLNAGTGTLSGWSTGLYVQNASPNTLKTTSMSILNLETCNAGLPYGIYLDQFCTYNENMTLFDDDNGNPLVVNNRLVGLLDTYSHPASRQQIYTNIYSHIEYIRFMLNR